MSAAFDHTALPDLSPIPRLRGPDGLQTMPSCAGDAAELIKALAHEARMRILCHLNQSEKTVGELEELLGLRQAAVSQQLARLRTQGLVQSRREGRMRLYSISDTRARAVVGLLHDLYCIG